jgi:hypothetical protein
MREGCTAADKKNERQDESQFITKIGGKTSLSPSYFVLSNFHSLDRLTLWITLMSLSK